VPSAETPVRKNRVTQKPVFAPTLNATACFGGARQTKKPALSGLFQHFNISDF
jgi:hypothetical protein